MATLRIRIGASVDSSVNASFASIEKAAQRAGGVIRKQLSDATRGAGSSSPRAASAAAENAGKAISKSAQDAVGNFKALSTVLKGMPADLKTIEREATRALQAMSRQKAREALGLRPGGPGQGRPSRFWFPLGGNLAIQKPHMSTLHLDPISGIAGFGMSAASYLRQAAVGYAHAHGYETDVQRMVEKNVSEEAIAQKIANAGYLPGTNGANSVLQSRSNILAAARKTAFESGTERGDVLQGLSTFVGKTGDLALGQQMLTDLAKLSRATGSEFNDMADAAAEVANHLGDLPNKGQVTYEVMKQIAGQGKLGAIEIKDMAAQMAKVAATANQFKGGAAANIATLGVFAQESKLEGGSASSVQAATSVARFVSGLTSERSLKHWQAHGFKNGAFTDAGHSEFEDPLTIVKMALKAASGKNGQGKADKTVLQELFPNVMAYRAVAGWEATYNRAGGGDKGMQAVTDEFERLKQAQLTNEEVMRAFSAAMQTSEAQSKQFNEQIAALAEGVDGKLMPAVAALAPAFVDLAELIARIATSDAVMTLLGIDKDQQDRDKAGTAQNDALSFLSTMQRWEQNSLQTNAEGQATPNLELDRATPILAAEGAKEKELQHRIDPLAARVAEERSMLTRIWHEVNPHSQGEPTDAELTKFAQNPETGGKSASAEKFLADLPILGQLTDTMKKMQTERENLVRVLTNGSVTVRVVEGATPRPPAGGVMPGESR